MRRFAITAILALLPVLASADGQEARLLRFPSVGGDRIAFTYAGDLYTVPVNGGTATRLTSDEGFEIFSRFSPDGRTIAFTAQYDGNTEVYTIPAEGGVPRRITYTSSVARDDIGDRVGPNNIVMGWTPDGRSIIYRSRWYAFSSLRGLLFTVPAEGGEPVQIPTTEGSFCSYSPDGTRLALNRMYREFRTWKYYRGGQADDIWINTVGTTSLENITDNDAQDVFPMWIGDRIYFLSDRDSIMNLFCYDTATRNTEKLTDFTEYDCKFPSFSQDWIVFENGGYIYRYSVKDGSCSKVTVYLNDEGILARDVMKTWDNAPGRRSTFSLSPDGSRVLTTFRGDVFSVPAAEGAVYNFTRTPGAHDREAVWSPDGQWIAWLSDESGEYQVYVMPYDDPRERICLTSFENGYPSSLTWDPGSQKLYFTTEKNQLLSVDIRTKKLRTVFEGRWGGVRGFDFSADGGWLAYCAPVESGASVIFLMDLATGESTPVTSSWYNSSAPLFSEDGCYLFFTSARDLRAVYSAVEWNAAYSLGSYLFALPLTREAADPTIIRGDEYEPEEETAVSSAADGPRRIDFDGIVERAVALPVEGRYLRPLAAWDGALYYRSSDGVRKISLDDLKVSDVTKYGVLALTPDHSRALVSDKGTYYVVSTSGYKADRPVPMGDIRLTVDYRKEWKQIYDETWRVYRDYFYVDNMVGRDWDRIHAKYAVMLPYVRYRQDLTYLIGEMISELNTGHCYVTTGETPAAEKLPVGLLGARIAKDETGYFRINRIFAGVTWGDARRSPLGEPGLNVHEGDYILAVNGVPASELGTVYEALVGRVGVTTALLVNSSASVDGARTVYVDPIADETQLAYYDWVQNNIRKVDEASDGRIGYIHIPDMSVAGLDEFTRLFYSQLDKEALIIDDRMNGGGNVSPMILERLQREVYRMTMARNGSERPGTIPESAHYGPKVCLIDKYSSSDGDLFPYGFRRLGIGKLIGTRTWGGIVGISGSKPYLDGQDVRTPFFTSYSTDGSWIIENHGVDPDIECDLNPFEDYLGRDAQLDKAVEVLLEELRGREALPGVPEAPVR